MNPTRLFPLLACSLPILSLPRFANAHTLLLSRGDVLLQEDRVVVEVQMSGDDFLHGYDLSIDPEGLVFAAELTAIAQRHAGVLEEALVIRDQSGGRLQSDGFRLDPHWSADAARLKPSSTRPRYFATFQMRDQSSLLAFQLWPSLRASTPWQVVLRVRGASAEEGTIVLTNRGNLDMVHLGWTLGHPSVASDSTRASSHPCRHCNRRGAEQLREICADIAISGNMLTADVRVPLPILASFKGITLAPRDFISIAEQTALLDAARPVLARAVTVRVAGTALDAELVSLEAMNPFEKPGGNPGNETVSYWLGSLRARIRFISDAPLNRATIRWELFNNAVLTSQASIRSGEVCIEHEFSTYAPEYEWISR